MATSDYAKAGFTPDPSGKPNAQVQGNGGSITVGDSQSHPGQTFISVETGRPSQTTGQTHRTFVTQPGGGLSEPGNSGSGDSGSSGQSGSSSNSR